LFRRIIHRKIVTEDALKFLVKFSGLGAQVGSPYHVEWSLDV